MQELIELEKQGWRALSSEGEAGKDVYSSVLAEDAVMLFPGGILIDGKENILESIGSQPWESFEIEDPRVIRLSEDAGVLAYKVSAQREGSDLYVALVSSIYVLDQGTWRLVFHQQTPV